MKPDIKKKAVFLDRDGTIIHDNGYLSDTAQVEFFPDTFEALKRLQSEYELFIVTNQSGISKGITAEEDVQKVNDYIDGILRSHGIIIREWMVCPHQTEDNCACKKPKPFFSV